MIIQSCCASTRRQKKCQANLQRNALFGLKQTPYPFDSPYSRKISNSSTESSSTVSSTCDDNLHLVDYSYQNLGALPDFVSENSDNIEHLILDGNQLTEHTLEEFPCLKNLQTLSLNSNKVKNIGICFQLLQRKCPNLHFLSLIGNPGWPHPIKNGDLKLYATYARAATKFLPALRFLDATALFAGANRANLSQDDDDYSNSDSSSLRSNYSDNCPSGIISSSHRAASFALPRQNCVI